MIRLVRLYTGSDGQSHFEDSSVPLTPSDARDALTGKAPATAVYFEETVAGSKLDWHNDPHRRYVVTLDGTVEFETRTGATFRSSRVTFCSPRMRRAAGTGGGCSATSPGVGSISTSREPERREQKNYWQGKAPAHEHARGHATGGAQGGPRPPGALEPLSGGERLNSSMFAWTRLATRSATRCCAATLRSTPCLPTATALSVAVLSSAIRAWGSFGSLPLSADLTVSPVSEPAMLDLGDALDRLEDDRLHLMRSRQIGALQAEHGVEGELRKKLDELWELELGEGGRSWPSGLSYAALHNNW